MPDKAGFPAQQQQKPGRESEMQPKPQVERQPYKAAGKLLGKKAIITGADSGIGRSIAVHYAKEGADVAVIYLNEQDDARETKRLVEKEGRVCLLLAGDVGDEGFCRNAAERALREFGSIDVLVNNAGEQQPQPDLQQISAEQLQQTFRTNIFGYFYMAKAVEPYLKPGSCIINTASVTAYKGSPQLIDYSATKGAIVGFTRSLSDALVKKGIRVNAVAPGPIWTPLIPSSFPPEKLEKFGSDVPMGRAGQPDEVAPAYVFLACEDSSYISGQVIHVNGGTVVNS